MENHRWSKRHDLGAQGSDRTTIETLLELILEKGKGPSCPWRQKIRSRLLIKEGEGAVYSLPGPLETGLCSLRAVEIVGILCRTPWFW